jgi:nucleoside-diphosphate-sugar epimerase
MCFAMKVKKLRKALVTGASGFVGQSLCRHLLNSGIEVVAAVRRKITEGGLADIPCAQISAGEIHSKTDWATAIAGVDTVFHLAARVHVMRENAGNPLEEFRKVNVAGTEHLARSAVASGVKRLVYVSSIGVNGLLTDFGRPFSETDNPNPHNAYAISKWEAEQCLSRVAADTGLEVVIVRPPLVYGAGAPGNFAQMLKVLARGMPLPFASVDNRRSLIYVGNLVDALALCATHPAAAGQTYLVGDGEDISTSDLLRRLGVEMGHPARLFPCPQAFLKLAGLLTGKSDQVERLLGSLQVDSGKIRRELNWRPPYTLEQGLRATAERYCGEKRQ